MTGEPPHERAPLVSVVIATNRDSPYLGDALSSVVAQSHPDIEVIVVDNGVPDTAALERTVSRAPGAVILRMPPATVSVARNAGAAAARGELLVFLDDDDVWHPERLARQSDALAAAPDAPASYCGGWHMDATGRPFPPSWPAVPATADAMLSGRSRLPHICGAMMIRRSAFGAIGGFSPELTMMEDFELAIRLLALGSFACVPDELVGYRRHDGNVTNTGIGNVRVRREAVDLILERHQWAARARGDRRMAALLAEHRRRERRRSAREAGAMSVWAVRHGRLTDAAREFTWGLRAGFGRFVAGMAARLARRG